MINPQPHRLANLPGYDTAPDIYETPDDASATTTTTLTQQTSPRSPSPSSDTTEEEDEESISGVNRRRLYPERARSRFSAESRRTQLESRGVDLGDRVDGRRRGYKVRRRFSGEVGDGEEEGLEARIARLRREVEECRIQAGGVQEGEGDEDGAGGAGAGVAELSKLLAGIEMPTRREKAGVREGAASEGEEVMDEQALGRVADFDSRLSVLEQSLGISAVDSTATDAVTTPILPSLTLLDQQLSALTSATSLANLEAASSRIQKIRKEVDTLSQPRSRPSTADKDASVQSEEAILSPEDLTKLQSLYKLLPTLQSLSPTVPALLTRLRSLRTLHTTAANAASDLEEVESRQAEMDKELKGWREGLEKVEQAVQEAGEANGRNGKVVEGWVRGVEGKMQGLR